MTSTCPQLVVFDMAGTTIQIADQIPAALQRAFEPLGVTLSAQQIANTRGLSKHDAIAQLLAAHEQDLQQVDPVHEQFKRNLLELHASTRVRPIPGAIECFERLRNEDVAIALTTGFDRELAGSLIAQLSWEDAVHTMVCNDDVPAGRPAPWLIYRAMQECDCVNVRSVVTVGDTVADLEAAANAGVTMAIGVTSGAHDAERLRQHPHHAILDSVAEVPSLILPLLNRS